MEGGALWHAGSIGDGQSSMATGQDSTAPRDLLAQQQHLILRALESR